MVYIVDIEKVMSVLCRCCSRLELMRAYTSGLLNGADWDGDIVYDVVTREPYYVNCSRGAVWPVNNSNYS